LCCSRASPSHDIRDGVLVTGEDCDGRLHRDDRGHGRRQIDDRVILCDRRLSPCVVQRDNQCRKGGGAARVGREPRRECAQNERLLVGGRSGVAGQHGGRQRQSQDDCERDCKPGPALLMTDLTCFTIFQPRGTRIRIANLCHFRLCSGAGWPQRQPPRPLTSPRGRAHA